MSGMVSMEHARKIVELENKAKAAVETINQASMELTRMGHDVVLIVSLVERAALNQGG